MATKKTGSSRSSKSKSSSSTPKVTVDKDSSVGVRQIENGYVVSESGYTGKGKNQKWYNKEYFSKTNPLKGITTGMSNSNGGGSRGIKFSGRK